MCESEPRITAASSLLGKLFDENGERLSPSHTRKRGRRYRYYISRRLVTGRKENLQGRGWRLPAGQLEKFIAQAIRDYQASSAGNSLVADPSIETLNHLSSMADADETEILDLLRNAQIQNGALSLSLDEEALAAKLNIEQSGINVDQLAFEVPFTRKRRGVETRLVMSGPLANQVDAALVGNIARAHAWLVRVKKGESFEEIATSENISQKRVQQTLEYAFLAPDIMRDILAGKQPLGLTSTWVATHMIPSDWAEQRTLIASL